MEFTAAIKPDTFSSSSIIFDWIKEDRAYYSKDLKTWNKFPIALLPHLSNLEGLWFKAEYKAKPPKFKVGDKVTVVTPEHYLQGRSGKINHVHKHNVVSVEFEEGRCVLVNEHSLAASKFKVGDRVTLYAPMHSHNGETGEIVWVWDRNKCSVRFDGHSCTHTVDINSLAIAGQTELNPLKWAEGLIKQLPQTHDGRNSWLMNYGEMEEVITDPEAVAQLVRNRQKVVMHGAVDGGSGKGINVPAFYEVPIIKDMMERNTFTWIRRA